MFSVLSYLVPYYIRRSAQINRSTGRGAFRNA
jgi:hypothetical protein